MATTVGRLLSSAYGLSPTGHPDPYERAGPVRGRL